MSVDLLLLVFIVISVFAAKLATDRWGLGAGVMAFVAIAALCGVAAAGLDIELGDGCYDYGPRVQAEDYC